MPARGLPQTIIGYVFRHSGMHQVCLAVLSVAVFSLSTIPLELQRRIVNDAIGGGEIRTILWLAVAYGGVALAEQGFKLILNVYRGWVNEGTVRRLRKMLDALPEDRADASGTHVAMMVDEVLPIGGFIGMSVSEPLLQGGILISVVGYMIFLESYMALLSLAFVAPQMVFVPLMQQAINPRAADRIRMMREVSSDMIDTGTAVDARIERVFSLNMGIYKIKYGMNLLMNLTISPSRRHSAWVAGSSWPVASRSAPLSIVAGLGKLNDPWGDLVGWGREFSVVGVKYPLFADALAQGGGLPRRSEARSSTGRGG